MALPPENVEEYPRPPALEPAGARIRGVLGGRTIFDTEAALRVLETHHAPTYYIPRDEIDATLTAVHGGSICEWKGRAAYWTLEAGGAVAEAAAWSYPDPTPRFAALRDHLAIYAGRLDAAFVDDERVVPQPGDFYGGWATSNLRGRIKGAPGTRHW